MHLTGSQPYTDWQKSRDCHWNGWKLRLQFSLNLQHTGDYSLKRGSHLSEIRMNSREIV